MALDVLAENSEQRAQSDVEVGLPLVHETHDCSAQSAASGYHVTIEPSAPPEPDQQSSLLEAVNEKSEENLNNLGIGWSVPLNNQQNDHQIGWRVLDEDDANQNIPSCTIDERVKQSRRIVSEAETDRDYNSTDDDCEAYGFKKVFIYCVAILSFLGIILYIKRASKKYHH